MSYPTAREEQAAYWYLKLQEPEVSAEEIQAALAWQRDPENRAAFERVAAFWCAWPREAPAPADNVSPQRTHRSKLWQCAAAALVVVIVGIWATIFQQQQTIESTVQEYATTVGQIRTVRLDDGSEVVLGGATSMHIDFSGELRRIVMTDGEALFHVAKDARRPFIVNLPNGSAQALGTIFNVHRGPDEATISVIEGAVQVSPPSWREAPPTDLHAGTQVSLSTDGIAGRVRDVSQQDIASWRSGRMIFVDQTLRSVVADLNRYSSKRITLAASEAESTRVSGSVKQREIEDWLRALGPAVGVNIVQNEHGVVLASKTDLNSSP